jgi:hypothetical protein
MKQLAVCLKTARQQCHEATADKQQDTNVMKQLLINKECSITLLHGCYIYMKLSWNPIKEGLKIYQGRF